MNIRIIGPAGVSLFLYDNSTMVIESFNDKPIDTQVFLSERSNFLSNFITGEKLSLVTTPEVENMGTDFSPETYLGKLTIPRHSFFMFQIEQLNQMFSRGL